MSTILPGNQESAALALDGGMYGLLARRQSMMEVEPFIEHPDCARFDFGLDSDTQLSIGYYMLGNVDYIILDGALATFYGNGKNNEKTYVDATAGRHIMYIHIKGKVTGSHLYSFPYSCSYVRIPYNVNEQSEKGITGADRLNGITWDVVDILEPDVVPTYAGSGGTSNFWTTSLIRVPIGTKQKYIDAGANATRVTSKMVEVYFNYKI